MCDLTWLSRNAGRVSRTRHLLAHVDLKGYLQVNSVAEADKITGNL